MTSALIKLFQDIIKKDTVLTAFSWKAQSNAVKVSNHSGKYLIATESIFGPKTNYFGNEFPITKKCFCCFVSY